MRYPEESASQPPSGEAESKKGETIAASPCLAPAVMRDDGDESGDDGERDDVDAQRMPEQPPKQEPQQKVRGRSSS
jgi:hypothetical protein